MPKPVTGENPAEVAAEIEMDYRQRLAVALRDRDAAQQRIALARQALIDTNYWHPDEVTDDIAPRIAEFCMGELAALRTDRDAGWAAADKLAEVIRGGLYLGGHEALAAYTAAKAGRGDTNPNPEGRT